MRIVVTGAGGNVGKGIVPRLLAAGHEVVLHDVTPLPPELKHLPFVQGDVQAGVGLDRAAAGADLFLHLPAWHGIHWNQRTETDFWRLNVDGAFYALQSAKEAGIRRFVFLSSQAWHGQYDKYGFTKRVGEELCEYHRRNHGIRYVAVRPADFTPWGDDWTGRYGARLLYGGVDREDVLDCVQASVDFLEREPEGEGLVVNAVRASTFDSEATEGWEEDPQGHLERIFPGSGELAARYGLPIDRRPGVPDLGEGAQVIGYRPSRHFGTFLKELRQLDLEGGEAAVRAKRCEY